MGLEQGHDSTYVGTVQDVDMNARFYLALLVAATTLYGITTIVAQEQGGRPTTALNQKTIPVSVPNSRPTENTGLSASSQAPVGWMVFEKCPVFALESVEIASQEPGVIASIDVKENESVEPNQVLGKLDGKVAELEKSISALQAQVASAEAADESEIRLAEAIVEESQLQLDIVEETTARGSTGASELRQKQLALTQAKVRWTQAKTAKQQRELKSKLAQASLFLNQQKLDRLTFRSPIPGTIAQIHHQASEWVQAGAPIFQVLRLDQLRVDCLCDLEIVNPASLVDQSVKVIYHKGANEKIFAGKLVSYDPDVSVSGKIRFRAIVQNLKQGSHWILLPGMSVTMQVVRPK